MNQLEGREMGLLRQLAGCFAQLRDDRLSEQQRREAIDRADAILTRYEKDFGSPVRFLGS